MNLQEVIILPQWEQLEPLEWLVKSRMDEFLALHAKHPLPNHHPSYISLSEAFWLWNIVKDLDPSFVVESGSHHGYSAWWLRQALRCSRWLYTFDPNGLPGNWEPAYWAHYSTTDFAAWQTVDYSNSAFAFFDDHVDQPERLQQASKKGFRDVCFHDVYPQANSAHVSLWRTGLPEHAICMQFPILRSPDVFREPARSMSAWLTWVRLVSA